MKTFRHFSQKSEKGGRHIFCATPVFFSFYRYVLFIYRHHIFYDRTSNLIYHIGIFELYIAVITIFIPNINGTGLLISGSTVFISCRHRDPVCFIQTIFCKIFDIIVCTLGKRDDSPATGKFTALLLFLISRGLTILCNFDFLQITTADRWQCVVLRQG